MSVAEDIKVPWYIVQTYSGQEERVKRNLDLRVETMDVKDKIFQVIVPTEEVVDTKDGTRKTISKMVFPGYIVVQMVMDEQSWYVVRNTPGVTGFISAEDEGEKRPEPVPLDDSEIQTILDHAASSKATISGYEKGQMVRITDGPFVDFMGTIDEVYPVRSKVRALVSFFGRETPVELDFAQIEKV